MSSVTTSDGVRAGVDGTRHRRDIQGLRALAVVAVVLYHAGWDRLSGGFVGVDLFFVISGFLITGLLLGEWERTGRISLGDFWARRARRLLPASSLVLVVTAAAAALAVHALERAAVAKDILWAAAFSANWRFAQQDTDYLAEERAVSPVLHFWSLGVEEQFYVLWPVMLVGVILVVLRVSGRPGAGGDPARVRRRVRMAVGTLTALLVGLSFVYCLHMSVTSQPYAFFGTPSRAWQLGVGALLAVAAPLLVRVGRAAAEAMALFGLVGFTWALLALQETGAGAAYPGWQAVLPTVAGALMIAAGVCHRATLVGRVLSVRPLQVVGDLSYSWYLWHFPLLVLGPALLGSDDVVARAGLLLASFGLAWVSYRHVESPLRARPSLMRRRRHSLSMGAGLVAVAAASALLVPVVGTSAATTVVGAQGESVALRPSPAAAPTDYISMRDAGCDLDFEQTEMPSCDFADTTSARRVVLLGDSHAVMLYPPLERAASNRGWRLNSWTKSACSVADVTLHDPSHQRAFEECDRFRRDIVERVIAVAPDVIVVASSANRDRRVYDRRTGELLSAARSRPVIRSGLRRSIRDLSRSGARIVVVVDPPRAPFDPPSCLAETADVSACSFPRPSPGPERRAVRGLAGVELFGYTRDFCEGATCTPVHGDVLLYRDTNHVTRTYALTLADRFERVLAP